MVAAVAVTFSPGWKQIEKALAQSPLVVYRHLRDLTDHCTRSFRKNFIAGTGIKLRPNRVAGINAGERFTFVFKVTPEAKAAPDAASARAMTAQLKGEAYSRSLVMLAHETGATITAKGGALAIPLKKGGLPKPPSAYRGKRKFFRKGSLLLERRGKAVHLGPGTSARGRITARYALARSITLKPRLRFVAIWVSLEANRGEKSARIIEAMNRDLVRGVAA